MECQGRQVSQESSGPCCAGMLSPVFCISISLLTSHSQVYQCAWSADSRLLVTGSKDCTLKVWNARNGSLAMDLPGHEDEVIAPPPGRPAFCLCFTMANTCWFVRSTPLTGRQTGRWSARAGRTKRCGRGGIEQIEGRTGADDTLPCSACVQKDPITRARCDSITGWTANLELATPRVPACGVPSPPLDVHRMKPRRPAAAAAAAAISHQISIREAGRPPAGVPQGTKPTQQGSANLEKATPRRDASYVCTLL